MPPNTDTTIISGAQCAAARALLGWSQDDLSKNAGVARATITMFEGDGKGAISPQRQNLLSIIATLEQAGVQFIPEDVDASLGAGVRRRALHLEYSNNLRESGWDLIFPVRYKGQECDVTIRREIIDDIIRGNTTSAEDRKRVVQAALPQFLGAIEKMLRDQVPPAIDLDYGAFPRGTF